MADTRHDYGIDSNHLQCTLEADGSKAAWWADATFVAPTGLAVVDLPGNFHLPILHLEQDRPLKEYRHGQRDRCWLQPIPRSA
jgi:hypothetical protein